MNTDEIILDIDDILSKDVGEKENKKIDSDINLLDEIQLSDGVHGKVSLTNLGESILANFSVNVGVKQVCGRCAKDFIYNVKLSYDQIYKFDPGEDEFPILADRKIDVWPSIRQEIIINIPIKTLCNNSCKNLNIKQ